MKTLAGLFLLLIIALASFQSIHSQDQSGFISLDCGLLPKDTTYVEKTTNLTYISDGNFIDSGVVGKINETLRTQYQQQVWNLRSFPEGKINCYNFNLTGNQKYLIRGTFVYGNYDGLNQHPSFDLYIGSNKWTGVQNSSVHEIIHVLPQDRLQVCLVKTGDTTPYISSLEIRPLNNSAYVSPSGSLMLLHRVYFPPTSPLVRHVRYDEDIYDRIWEAIPDEDQKFSSLSTDLPVDTSNLYNIPQVVAKTALVPENASQALKLHWALNEITAKTFVYMHFAEIQNLGDGEIREFNITYNGGLPWFSFFRPSKLSVQTIFNLEGVTSPDGRFDFTFTMTGDSTLPPILNGLEIYQVLDF